MNQSFAQRIAAMNAIYRLDANGKFLKRPEREPKPRIKALREARGVNRAA